jgi:signal transduction histidine kinase
MRLSFRAKTIVGIATIEGVLLLIIVLTAISFLTEIIDETLTKRASTTASLFATTTKDAVLAYDLASLEAFTQELMENPDLAYIKVLGQNGEIFASRGEPYLIERPFKEDRALSDVTDGIFDATASIRQGDFIFGRVELGIGIQSTQLKIAEVQKWSASLAIIELLIVAIFSFVLGSYLTRQLKSLLTGSREIRHALKTRNFEDVNIVIKGRDEFSELAVSFNKLVKLLRHELVINQKQQDELQELNTELEQKVELRTEALNLRNKELSKINIEMQETQKQLLHAEKMASVGQLAAGVAHEINNPLGFVSSNLASLKDYVSAYKSMSYEVSKLVKGPESKHAAIIAEIKQLMDKEDFDFINQDISELLEESDDGLKRMAEIVANMKLFSRPDTGKKQLFDINACLNTTLNMVNNELKYHCKVEVDLQSLPKIPIDVGKINQVLTNLLINASHAIKATSKHGLLEISTLVDNEHVVIHIKDSGTGMSAATMSKIFNPFFTTKPEGSGTGLGLSISFGIIAEHGGELSVISVLEQGSCFTIKLPINSSVSTKGDALL